MPTSKVRVVVVGAGFGGVATAIELQKHGFRDVVVLDAADGIGGTWLHNTYPGAACDVPSHLYSFSFAQRRDWDRLCPLQPQILGYLRGVARQHGVDRLVETGVRVTACEWDDAQARWTVTSEDGRTWEAEAVVLATGQLHQPSWPRVPGLESFDGEVFHSARWRHDVDLRGKRVAVVGTGASAVQFVPEVAGEAARTTVFQRTGNWFLPRKNRPYPALVRAAVRLVPGLQSFRRRFVYEYGEVLTLAIRHPRTVGLVGRARSAAFMRWQLRGRPDLRRAVWPDYTFGCKRVLFSSHWLPTLRRPDVDLVTDAVAGVAADGVVTADGTLHPADVIIWGTGFRTNDFMFPMEVTGRAGLSLRDAWSDGAHAHLGITVPGFPSMFVLYGPNTNTSGGSIVTYLEAQVRYLRQALEHVRETEAAAVEVRADVEAAFDSELQARFPGTAWTACDSWYRTPGGRIVANWPGYMREYEQATERFDPAAHRLVAAPGADRGTIATT